MSEGFSIKDSNFYLIIIKHLKTGPMTGADRATKRGRKKEVRAEGGNRDFRGVAQVAAATLCMLYLPFLAHKNPYRFRCLMQSP